MENSNNNGGHVNNLDIYNEDAESESVEKPDSEETTQRQPSLKVAGAPRQRTQHLVREHSLLWTDAAESTDAELELPAVEIGSRDRN